MDTIRFGVIGCGYWGPNLIRNFVEIPDATVVVVADLREDRLARIKNSHPQIAVTTDYHDLFKMNLDAIIVATHPSTHFQFALEALQHGHHVLVEKPMTLNSLDGQKLIDEAKARNLTLMVGHTFMYNSAIRALKELIDRGELGQVYYLDSARLNLGLFQRDINVLWDLAPHDLSILFYLLGSDPVAVSAQGVQCVFDGICDVVYLNLLFPDDVMAHIHLSWLEPCKVRRTTIVGSKKMVVYNDIETSDKIKIYDKGVERPPYTDSFGELLCNYRYGDVLIPNIRFVEPLRMECLHFIECIRTGQTPLTGGADGLKVVKVLEAAQLSLDKGNHKEMIQWNPETLYA
jgi:predicted dehydrogenase